jgi:osmotically-inducible protein OsmY
MQTLEACFPVFRFCTPSNKYLDYCSASEGGLHISINGDSSLRKFCMAGVSPMLGMEFANLAIARSTSIIAAETHSQQGDHMKPTDEQIKVDIVDALRWDTGVDASDVKVGVDNGVATLSGTVPSYGASTTAFYDAYFTKGVTRVENELTIRLSSDDDMPTEARIKEMAENVIRWTAAVEDSGIEITAKGGQVRMTGIVPLYSQRLKAEELVSGISGVTGVENELVVVPTKQIGDELIAEDLMAALRRSFILNPATIEVKVSEGIVTLAGEVATSLACWWAEKTADATLGVRGVRNCLEVKYI